MADKEVDWKSLAEELAQHVIFAVSYLKHGSGDGMVANFSKEPLILRPWREPMADTLEKMPGVTIDREKLAAMALPARKRRQALAIIDARRRADTSEGSK